MYAKESIYILQYPIPKETTSNETAGVSFGIIRGVRDYYIYHTCNTGHGSSGSSILASNNKLIGIYGGTFIDKYFNIGTFLNNPIKDLIKLNFPKINSLINYL